MYNLTHYFKEYLPASSNIEKIETKVLRGNVNTRIQKLLDDDFDAVVLALPGLERLSMSDQSREQLIPLIQNLTFMVPPQTEFPSAAAQGALAIECLKDRKDSGELYQKLQKVHCQTTQDEVSRERKAFSEYGGGCHLAVGIHVEKKKDFFCHFHRGFHAEQNIQLQFIENLNNARELPRLSKGAKVFLGLSEKKAVQFKSKYPSLVFDKLITKQALPAKAFFGDHLYVTSKYCFHALDILNKNKDFQKFLFAAGTKTMREMAALGFWVHGCADGLGETELVRLRNSEFLKLFYKDHYALEILSHDKTQSELAAVTPTYTHLIHEISKEYRHELLSCELFYWTSATEYRFFINLIPELAKKIHACGLGKTYDELTQKEKVSAVPFLSMREFEQYLKSQLH